jgi:hypothetical protein
MQTLEGFDFFPLRFDDRGQLKNRQELDAFLECAKSGSATDAIFVAHGFRNDEQDATRLYTNFLRTFRAHLSRSEFASVSARRFIVAGVYWPSKPFREDFDEEAVRTRQLSGAPAALAEARADLEELKQDDSSPTERRNLDRAIELLPTLENNLQAQDEFVRLVLSILDSSPIDENEGLPQIRQRSGSEILASLSPPPPAGTRGIGDVAGSIAGGLGRFLNLTKWYVMKNRSGTVGAGGVADAVRALHARVPEIRIHVVGHSLGARLAASVAKALCKAPKLELDSLMLLEAAFSHFGFSENNGRDKAGFFRDVVVHQVVKGPFIATFSAQDTVVGKAYSIMSRLAGDNTREIGDESDEFGGLGRNGPLKTAEVFKLRMAPAGTPYDYKKRVINSLDGSGGFIKDHGDVTNEAVTYAFASALART